MILKETVKPFVPQSLLDVYRKLKRISRPRRNLWEGVYEHFRDVPIQGEGYDSGVWAATARKDTEAVIANVGICGAVPKRVTGDRSLLPLLASLVCGRSGQIRILDFGGGMGIDFVFLVNGLTSCTSIDYHIVETENMCREGRLLFKNDERIHFSTSVPVDLADVDIVYLNSVLQYVEDYEGLLRRLSEYRPRYFLFARLSAGNVPTYATAQKNMAGTALAYWFFNVNEIVEIMLSNRYSLVFRSVSEHEYSQENFPQHLRLGRTCNLLFERD